MCRYDLQNFSPAAEVSDEIFFWATEKPENGSGRKFYILWIWDFSAIFQTQGNILNVGYTQDGSHHWILE